MFFRSADNQLPDDELLKRYVVDQRLEWLSVLYSRYTSMVYGVCLKYLKDRHDAQDAVMHIYEKLIEDLLRHEIINFRGWLYVNARNHCLMQLRAKKGRPTEELSPLLMENGPALHPEDDVKLDETHHHLTKCLEQLVEPQQRCITLFYLEEKSYREISTATGFDPNQVKSYIQNGKRNLKICLEKHG